MSNNLKITLNAETSFEFELSVSGIDVSKAKVRFGLEKNGVTLQFPCKKKGEKWNVVVPPLDSFGLKEGLYSHTIELIANGYYFAPVKGTAEVAPAASVTGSLVNKDVKVKVTGIKVTESKPIIETQKRKTNKVTPVKTKRPDLPKKIKPLVEKMPDRRAKNENKFNLTNKDNKTRLQELAGIK